MAAEALATPTVPRDSACSPAELVASPAGTCLLSRHPRLSSPSDRLPGSQAGPVLGLGCSGWVARAGVLAPVPSAEPPPSLLAAQKRPSARVPHVLVGSTRASQGTAWTLGPFSRALFGPAALCTEPAAAATPRQLFRPLHERDPCHGPGKHQGLQPVRWPPCSPQPVGSPGTTSVRVPGCAAAPRGSQRRGRRATLSQCQQHEAVHSGPLGGTAV